MLTETLLIIIITSFIQSIFGVGVLLFGTPLLMLLGYDFIQAVTILLPISVSINIIQIIKEFKSIDFTFYKKILIYTIPFVIIFLFIVTKIVINIGIIIGFFLLFVALKNFSTNINNMIDKMVRFEKSYFISMGIIHGLTNLGGSLLTAIIHSKNYDKQETRATVAVSYATFAVFQILTLLMTGHIQDFALSNIGIYLLTGITVFIFTERIVYMDLSAKNYSKSFATFLFLSGILLCVKYF